MRKIKRATLVSFTFLCATMIGTLDINSLIKQGPATAHQHDDITPEGYDDGSSLVQTSITR